MPIAAGILLLATCWYGMWQLSTFWNPLFFVGLWIGAALIMYSCSRAGYPGVAEHVRLAIVSAPVWWWFELVNERVENWLYVMPYDYSPFEYAAFTTIAFATVLPALDSAGRLLGARPGHFPSRNDSAGWPRTRHWVELAAGVVSLALMAALPRLFFPLVWVGPFLIIDAMVGLTGGKSFLVALASRQWRVPVIVGLAGLLCGFLWEFWNYWAMPKWVYEIPYLETFHLFEMPLAGYLGYIPFAWSMHQLMELLGRKRVLIRGNELGRHRGGEVEEG